MSRLNKIKNIFPFLALLLVIFLVSGCSSNNSRIVKSEFVTTQVEIKSNDLLSPDAFNGKASRVIGIFQTLFERLTQLISRLQFIPKFNF